VRDGTQEYTLNPLLLDQLALVFAQAALENFLFLQGQRASDSPNGSEGTAGWQLVQWARDFLPTPFHPRECFFDPPAMSSNVLPTGAANWHLPAGTWHR